MGASDMRSLPDTVGDRTVSKACFVCSEARFGQGLRTSMAAASPLGSEPIRIAFLELLRRVRNTALEAYAHKDLPFRAQTNEDFPRKAALRNRPANAFARLLIHHRSAAVSQTI
jgi:hypothetical protein